MVNKVEHTERGILMHIPVDGKMQIRICQPNPERNVIQPYLPELLENEQLLESIDGVLRIITVRAETYGDDDVQDNRQPERF